MDSAALPAIRAAVEDWYAADHRSFPWRGTRDPWAVLVSEVMLQQTQASRVTNRFVAFMDRYPTPTSLAAASPAEVLAAWSGLGYYRRALALRATAAEVAKHGWPTDVDALAQLPGVGPYTARAIASLAFGIPVGPVDTNVRRWVSRRFGVAPPLARTVQKLADALAALGAGDPNRVAAWTHATMELGARICTARRPRCDACPIADGCPARDGPSTIPVPRQPRYQGSSRQARGAIVRWLSDADGHALPTGELRRRFREAFDASAAAVRFGALLREIERDGIAHRQGAQVHLGPLTRIGA